MSRRITGTRATEVMGFCFGCSGDAGRVVDGGLFDGFPICGWCLDVYLPLDEPGAGGVEAAQTNEMPPSTRDKGQAPGRGLPHCTTAEHEATQEGDQ